MFYIIRFQFYDIKTLRDPNHVSWFFEKAKEQQKSKEKAK